MGGGLVVTATGGRSTDYNSKPTVYVFVLCLVASSAGALFGYDLGITGGVTSMPNFLEKFFPSTYAKNQEHQALIDGGEIANNPYCTYNDMKLQAFTSTLFLSGLVFAIIANWSTKWYGRRFTMITAGAAFIVGAFLMAFAQNLPMLVVGRAFLGWGVGFANQSAPLYLSEMAPAQLRGALNIGFQMATTLGILVAGLINYGTQHMDKPGQLAGWRLSVGLAIVPALVLFFGGLLLPDTPNGLISRGKVQEGRRVLERVRGTKSVDAEFTDICEAVEVSKAISGKWRALFSKKYRGVLAVSVLIPFFQQFSGINTIMFYAAELFQVLGSGQNSSLLNTVIIGAVNVASTVVAIVMVDRFGRKLLFVEGGIQMLVCFIAVAAIMGASFNTQTGHIANGPAAAIIVFECLFTAGFAWSWGPLGWLVPSEVHSIETRSLGMSIATCSNFLFSFIIGQWYLTMLCSMEYGTYIFFAFWVVMMTLYVIFFLPETKGVPVEEMGFIWRRHWFWKNVIMTPAERAAFEKGDVTATGMTAAEIEGDLPGKASDAAVPQVARLSMAGEYVKPANAPEALGAVNTINTDYKV
ncbi:hypothetical protein WJX74_009836 [Apatococcus lobatus]|uniref:Major facilitator superfamily (MFS) profile domain-containing protein n=2 Tax=Apatococcus TaxID=904362 RepID=A0AAW1STS7_9CHLO